MEVDVMILTIAGTVALTSLLVWLICKLSMAGKLSALKEELAESQSRLSREEEHNSMQRAASANVEQILRDRIEEQRQDYETRLEVMDAEASREMAACKEEFEKRLKEIKEQNVQMMDRQLNAIKDQLVSSTGELLKQREMGLEASNRLGIDRMAQANKANMEALVAPLKESIANMEKAMDANRRSMLENKESHDKNTASLATELKKAVEDLRTQSGNIGSKAEELALALRSKSKIQGIWGETLLDNILEKEGLKEGRDYDREETLRDPAGSVVFNEDSGRKMRPDFIFHYPDGKDVVIDAKVSLKDYVDLVNAEDETLRVASLAAHLESIKTHIKELSAKNYSSYIKPPRISMDYVLMFIPNDTAWRVALNEEPLLWQQAYDKGVLVTTEQSIMPFLRIIKMAWTKMEQNRNQEEMVEAARRMLDRVSDFYVKYQDLGRKIELLSKTYGEAEAKLREGGQSIATAARQVVKLGGKPSSGKQLPEVQE